MGQNNIFEENLEVVENPQEDDVLCGKNKECLEHPGSKSFREVVDRYVERYQQADSKYMKMEITKEIYTHLSEQSSRFLKYNSKTGLWQELTSSAVRDKIGHALRFANRRKRNRKSKPNSSGDSPHKRTNSTSSSSSGYDSSDSSSHLDDTDKGLPQMKQMEGQSNYEFRPVTKMLQQLQQNLNIALPSSVAPPPTPANPTLPPVTEAKPEVKPVKRLSDGDVLSIMNAPLIEFEPQSVPRVPS